MSPEHWGQLCESRQVEGIREVLGRAAFGYRLIGGRTVDDPKSLPALISKALRERDFPKLNQTKQRRHLAFSIAAEGFVGIRRSRQICVHEELRRKATPSERKGGPDEMG
jgi:hypothetical protein